MCVEFFIIFIYAVVDCLCAGPFARFVLQAMEFEHRKFGVVVNSTECVHGTRSQRSNKITDVYDILFYIHCRRG